jgi:hypothetical protein
MGQASQATESGAGSRELKAVAAVKPGGSAVSGDPVWTSAMVRDKMVRRRSVVVLGD